MKRAASRVPIQFWGGQTQLESTFLVTSPNRLIVNTRLPQRPSPRFSSSLSQATNVRQLFAKNQKFRLWGGALLGLGLATLGAVIVIGHELRRASGFEDWPENVREHLRAGLAAKNAGDLKASSVYFLKAWDAMTKIPLKDVTDDYSTKISSLALTLGDVLEAEDPEKACDIYWTAFRCLPIHNIPLCSAVSPALLASVREWWIMINGVAEADKVPAEFVNQLVEYLDQLMPSDVYKDSAMLSRLEGWTNQQLLYGVALTSRLAFFLGEQIPDEENASLGFHLFSAKMVFLLWDFDTSRRTSNFRDASTTSNDGNGLLLPDWANLADKLYNPLLALSRSLRKLNRPEKFALISGYMASMAQVMLLKGKTLKHRLSAEQRCLFAEIQNHGTDMLFRVPEERRIDDAFLGSQCAINFCRLCNNSGYRDPVCDREYPIALLNFAEILEHKGDIKNAIYFYGQARLNAEKVGMRDLCQRIDDALKRLDEPPKTSPGPQNQSYRAS